MQPAGGAPTRRHPSTSPRNARSRPGRCTGQRAAGTGQRAASGASGALSQPGCVPGREAARMAAVGRPPHPPAGAAGRRRASAQSADPACASTGVMDGPEGRGRPGCSPVGLLRHPLVERAQDAARRRGADATAPVHKSEKCTLPSGALHRAAGGGRRAPGSRHRAAGTGQRAANVARCGTPGPSTPRAWPSPGQAPDPRSFSARPGAH